MNQLDRTPKVFTIPAGVPFAESFAAKLLQQNASQTEKLAEILVLLPTKRACRIVRDAFLRQSNGHALLLPRMQALGDVDEDGLSLEIAALSQGHLLDIPPGLPPLRRRLILSQLVMRQPAYASQPDQALQLADALGKLMDKIHAEGLDLADLPGLVEEEGLAEHWQITVEFLRILSQYWPTILADEGYIDMADRRDRLMRALADHWESHPPAFEIIAAGATGSVPAAARLLEVVAKLPRGKLILPGLDREMDRKSWDAMDDTHPQAILKSLLDKIRIERSKVVAWNEEEKPNRSLLSSELMRPAATTEAWRDLKKSKLAKDINGLERIDCASTQDEARLISLLFRYIQHQKNQTAALVTVDRDLARRVAAACSRWGLQIDDTAGIRLIGTRLGGFLALCAEACCNNLAPIPLLALLKHRHTVAGMDPGEYRHLVRRLDLTLRGPSPAPGLAGLLDHLKAWPDLTEFASRLGHILSPLLSLCDGHRHPFSTWLDAHILAAESLATSPHQPGHERLWRGEEGETAALFLAELRQYGGNLPVVTADQYFPVLRTLIQNVSVRPAWGTHPRLSILGPLESRLIQPDLMILGGLNEGSWPQGAEIDPWMSRTMRKSFGLPAAEREIGLSAHDFIQGLSAKRVIVTRSARSGGTPTLPSRWLQRLDAVLQASGLHLSRSDWLQRAHRLDWTEQTIRLSRPAPRPPVEKRPVRLSVTEIETWMRDPYAVYAKHVLGVKPLDDLEEKPDASDRGALIHTAMERFIKTYPERLPAQADTILKEMGHDIIRERVKDPRTLYFWTMRFDQAADWFINQETEWREYNKPWRSEVTGRMSLPETNFTLTAKADRIDLVCDGSGASIIDYKTGSLPKEQDIAGGLSPQLTLEAAMLIRGAFDDMPATPPVYLGYWKLSGGATGGASRKIKSSIDQLAEEAIDGLTQLVHRFAEEETPYYSVPRATARPRYSAYTHLARIKEWSVVEDGQDGGT